MLLHGAFGATGWGESDAGEHQYKRHADHGEARLRLDHHCKPHRCRRQSSRSRRGNVSEICRGCREGMSGLESVERENFPERKAGLAAFVSIEMTRFDSLSQDCRIEMSSDTAASRPPLHCQPQLPSWRNWQTRMVQVHVPATVWGFESLRWHQNVSVWQSSVPLGL